jgi:hypothetical protein
MKKLVLILVMFSLISFGKAQLLNRTKIDEQSQMEVLIGTCNREALKSDLFKVYFEPEYEKYTTDEAIITKLKKGLVNNNISITIVMGSWCGDSQEQVPRFYKVIDAIGFADSGITLICVDRTKKSDKGETDNLNIIRIPTFIIYKNGKEIGRIIETPKASLEKDLLEIISM